MPKAKAKQSGRHESADEKKRDELPAQPREAHKMNPSYRNKPGNGEHDGNKDRAHNGYATHTGRIPLETTGASLNACDDSFGSF